MENYNSNDYMNNQYEQSGISQPGQTYQYDNTFYAGANPGMNIGVNPSDFMDMNSGFEAGAQPIVSGIQNLGAIVTQEVVAKSFLFMVVGLLITAFASLTISPYVAIQIMFGTKYSFLLFFGIEIAVVMIANWAVSKNNGILAGVMFAVYAWMTGVLLTSIFVVFTISSIATLFFITAGLFGIMAIYGLVTGKDLTKAGNLLMMGLLGIVLAGAVNAFIGSSMLDTVICMVGVVIFVGLVAYDTQKIKQLAATADGRSTTALAMYGAIELYLDFINLFLKLLALFGKRK